MAARTTFRLSAWLAMASLLCGQGRLPPGQRGTEPIKMRQAGQQRGPQRPPQQAAPPAPDPVQTAPAPTPAPGTAAAPAPSSGIMSLQNASLTEVVDALARQLRINYVLDPRVKGSVTLNTYGEVKEIDTRSLLDMILRINGAAMVKVGDIYRIVPLAQATRLPIPPEVNAKDIPEDDQIMLNLIFLKYATVEELAKLLEPFIGEGAFTLAYPPANLL